MQSSELDAGTAPAREMAPKVGFRPMMPQQAAGMRIDPPVSVPIAKSTDPEATAAAEPLDDPPTIRSGNFGFTGVPVNSFRPVTP